MAVTVEPIHPVVPQPRGRGRWWLWRALVRRPYGAVALVVIGLVIATAILAPVLAPYPSDEIGAGPPRSGPIAGHPFGTDELGRDLLSRTMYAGRIAIGVTTVATLITIALGTLWGGIAAISGRWVDEVLMRIADAAIAIPFLLMALILVAAVGGSTWALAVVLAAVFVPYTARIIRAAFLAELHLDYVHAARAYGCSTPRLLYRELLPNVTPTLLVQAAVVASGILLTEAALSFLGVGIRPPDASWGTLLLDGYNDINSNPTATVFPGMMIFITVWALSALGDEIQMLLDPRSGVRRSSAA